MKYYLLTFNEDYADEHNVPALACFKEEEYLKWLDTPSGKLNPKFEEENKLRIEYEKKSKEFWEHLTKKGYLLNGVANTSMIPKTDLETLELEKEYRKLGYPKACKKVNSKLYASLGNSGDCFEESFEHLYLMEEFVKEGIVHVLEVSEEFYNTFHVASLNSLSLCNIFRIKK